MAGIPGSGKSTFVAKAQSEGLFPRVAFVLNPDIVMVKLPEYQDLVRQKGPEKAFTILELPARNLAYDLCTEAIKIRSDIIKDMGSSRQENYDMLKEIKASGYTLKMYVILVETREAMRRCALRKGRYTPPRLISERNLSLKGLIPKYTELVDELHYLDNNDSTRPFRKL